MKGNVDETLNLHINDPKLWSPDSPFFYDLKVELIKNRKVVDNVESYFGMCKISLGKDEHGILRLFLNNKPLFQFGPLDQGYWPDGLYTAPTDEALQYDIEVLKELGFNMARWRANMSRLSLPDGTTGVTNLVCWCGRTCRMFPITTGETDQHIKEMNEQILNIFPNRPFSSSWS